MFIVITELNISVYLKISTIQQKHKNTGTSYAETTDRKIFRKYQKNPRFIQQKRNIMINEIPSGFQKYSPAN